jgi:DNA-binding MarR family transcriptional regulator
MATLSVAGETDFQFLAKTLEISDSLLSKYASQLEASGYLNVVKGYVGKRPSTWYSLTDTGRAAFARYRATLGHILDDPGPASESSSAKGKVSDPPG